MQVQGITFVGARTPARAARSAFVRDVLQLAPVGGQGADFFGLPDGSSFAVTEPCQLAAGIPTDDVAMSETQCYVHFRAPDGLLYELLEDL